jgi:hypothetical protein
MARYSVQTKWTPEKAVEMAVAYFGEDGLGLEIVEQSPCCVHFEGGGGHVRVTAGAGESKTAVELETHEWDYHVRQFMRQIP